MNRAIIASPVGNVEISCADRAVVSILETHADVTTEIMDEFLLAVVRQLHEYFDGRRTEFSFAISPDGTEFQKMVWTEASRTPYGCLRSYGDIAASIGKRSAVRAVAGAIGRNPLLFVIPCHRVIGCDGLGGFRLGIDAKLALINLEKREHC